MGTSVFGAQLPGCIIDSPLSVSPMGSSAVVYRKVVGATDSRESQTISFPSGEERTEHPIVTVVSKRAIGGRLKISSANGRLQVRGIDITPHHHNPEEGLENLYLDIDDLNMSFQFSSNHFDLVNSRLVAGGINTERWTGYIRDIFRSLRPGGWVQMVEIDFNAQSDNGALADNSALRQWSQTYLFAMEQCKNPRAPRRLGGWLRNAGFTDVDERMIPLPMCAWSDNQRDCDIGAANQENVRMLLSSVAIYPFTHYLRYVPSKDMLSGTKGNVDDHSSMSITEFHVLVAKARTEAANPALKV
ncbi:hypothetical protein F5B21DRAFT_528431 [Xylaria acuta]|nr:hypothetical protein F5B21DRAFT_528431 [Xylaria acuta]